MRNLTKLLFIHLLLCGVIMNSSGQEQCKNRTQNNAGVAVILVAFGSTASQTLSTYGKIEGAFKKAFPSYYISWAFTSDVVVNKLKKNGKSVFLVNDAIQKLVSDGYSKIVLQSLHIMPGEEFRNIAAPQISGVKIVIGEPLLTSSEDINEVANVVSSLCDNNCPTVIAAHGNEKFPEFNKPLHEIAAIIGNKQPKTVMCTIEGPPGTEPFTKIKPDAAKLNCVKFIPLMLVAGVHVQEDLTGQDSSSWKNILGVSNVTITPSLGDIPLIHDIFINHCRKQLKVLGEM